MINFSAKFKLLHDLIIHEDDVNSFLEKYFSAVQGLLNLNSLVYYSFIGGMFHKSGVYGVDPPFADSMNPKGIIELFNNTDILKLGELSPLNTFYKQHLNFALIIRKGDDIFGMALVGKDVSERINHREYESIIYFLVDLGSIIADFYKIKASLIESNMALASPVLRSVTHDVRNPIQMITIMTEMLKAKELPLEKRLNLYNKLNEGLNQIDKIVTEVSELFKEEYDLNLDEVPCSIFFNDIKNQIFGSLQKIKIQLEFNINCNTTLEIDVEKMKDVILKMIKYSRDLVQFDGLISLSVEEGRDTISIIIVDTSNGIEPKVLKNQKNPFFNYGTRLGTGLNFAIMHKVIEAHRGSLLIQNEKDGGARYVITLPKRVSK